MFVVEKLPRERSEKLDQPTGTRRLSLRVWRPAGADRAAVICPAGKLEVLQRAVAAAIRAQLAVPWLPPTCRLPLQVSSRSRMCEKAPHSSAVRLCSCSVPLFLEETFEPARCAAFRRFSLFRLRGCCSHTTHSLSAYPTAPKVQQSSSPKVRLLPDLLPSGDSSAPAGGAARLLRGPTAAGAPALLPTGLPSARMPSDVQEYRRSFLRPVTAQISTRTSVVASVLEQHAAELSAAREWESEWNSQGLLSRLTPQVGLGIGSAPGGRSQEPAGRRSSPWRRRLRGG